ALFDRSQDRAIINDPRDKAVAIGRGDQDADRTLSAKFYRPLLAPVSFGFTDDLSSGEDLLSFKSPHAPIQNLACFISTLAITFHAAQSEKDTSSVALCTADNGVS